MSCAMVPPAVLDDAVQAILHFVEILAARGEEIPALIDGLSPTEIGILLARQNREAFLAHYQGRHPEWWNVDVDAYQWTKPEVDRPQLYRSLVTYAYQLEVDAPFKSIVFPVVIQAAEALAVDWFDISDVLAAHEQAVLAKSEWLRRDGRTHPPMTPPSTDTNDQLKEPVRIMSMPPETTIPLSQLDHSPSNVRAYQADPKVPSLAVSLRSRQIHPLLVLPGGQPDRFEVFAGGRRLEAFRLNVAEGHLPADHPVRVVKFNDAFEATEISLEENYHRLDMTPLDEAAAFASLVAQGRSIEDVASKFGVEQRYVRQRMRLSDLAQPVRDALHSGRINIAAAEAYASTSDVDRQASVFAELDRRGPVAHNPDQIRKRLRERGIAAGDKLALYVGMERYTAAGGKVEEDLFTPASEVILVDSSLLRRLVSEKIAEDLASLKSLGSYAEVREFTGWKPTFNETVGLEEVKPKKREATSAEQDELDRLRDAKEAADTALARALDNMPAEPTPESDAEMERLRGAVDAATAAIEAFEEKLAEPVDTTGLVAFVALRDNGTLSPPLHYRVKEAPKSAAAAPTTAPAAPAAPAAPPRLPTPTSAVEPAAVVAPTQTATPAPTSATSTPSGAPASNVVPIISFGEEDDAQTAAVEPAGETKPIEYSGPLATHLAFERAAVLKDALADHPDIAFDLLIFTMATAVFTASPGDLAAIGLAVRANPLEATEVGDAGEAFIGRLDLLDTDFLRAETQTEAFDRFRAMDEGSKFAWLGYTVARAIQPSLDWADTRGSLPVAFDGGSKRVDHAAAFHNHLAALMNLRLRDRWSPTWGNLFGRLNRNDLQAALREIGGEGLADGLRNAQRGDLAKTAEQLCAGRGHAGPSVIARAKAWTPAGMGFPADVAPDAPIDAEDAGIEHVAA